MIERLREVYDAFNRGDFDRALAFAHPDVEYHPPGGQAPFRGKAQMRAWMEPSAFDSQTVEPLEFEVSGNRALVRSLTRARGAGSGIEMEIESWTVWTLDDDGLVTRVETYLPHEEAEARAAFEGR